MAKHHRNEVSSERIAVHCSCGKKLSASSRHAGKRLKCPACGNRIEVPSSQFSSSSTAPLESSTADEEKNKIATQEPSQQKLPRTHRVLVSLILAVEVIVVGLIIVPVFLYPKGIDWDWDYAHLVYSLRSWMSFICFQAIAFGAFRLLGSDKRAYIAFLGFICLSSTPVFLYDGHQFDGHFLMYYYGCFRQIHFLGYAIILFVFAYPSTRNDILVSHSSERPLVLNHVLCTVLLLVTLLLGGIRGIIACIYATIEFTSVPESRPSRVSLSFEGLILFYEYLTISLIFLLVARIYIRKAMKDRDPIKLWMAGVLSTLGGLLHLGIVGLPAIIAGTMCLRAVERHSPHWPPSPYQSIKRWIGMENLFAIFITYVSFNLFRVSNAHFWRWGKPASILLVIIFIFVYAISTKKIIQTVLVVFGVTIIVANARILSGDDWNYSDVFSALIPGLILCSFGGGIAWLAKWLNSWQTRKGAKDKVA